MFENLKMMGTGIEEYNKQKEKDCEEIIFKQSFNEIEPIGYIDNIPVIRNNYLLSSYGTLFAMLVYDGKNYYILIDSLFDKLSAEGKKFALAHELGHKEFKHLENVEKKGTIIDINLEYEADSFAAKFYGYKLAKDALEELIDVASTVIDNAFQYIYFKNTMKKRKKHLMK